MKPKNRRIEPTFSGKQQPIEQPTYQREVRQAPSPVSSTLKQNLLNKLSAILNATKILWHKNKASILTPKNIKIVVISLLIIIFISTLVSFFSSSDDSLENDRVVINKNNLTPADVYERNHKVTFPDNFSLYASQYNGLTIHWQGEITSLNNVWNIAKAQGDKNCQAMTFNNGEKYSVIDIAVENSLDYFAKFSPLDSDKITKALAFRGHFTLCGYKFSLKGSQALLGKHTYYSELFSY